MELRPSEHGSQQVDVVLFEVGGRVLGADAHDVSRISRCEPGTPTVDRLGAPASGRALLVRDGEREVQVPIDRFVGIESAGLGDLRRLPRFLEGLVEPALVGFLMRAGEIVLLIDLQALVKEGEAAENAEGIGEGAR